MFFGIGDLSPLSSLNHSQIYSIHFSRTLCFSKIIVSSLDFIHPEDKKVLLPVISLIFLYIDVVSFSLACSISLHWMSNQDSFASVHFLFISLSGVFYMWLYLSVTFFFFSVVQRCQGISICSYLSLLWLFLQVLSWIGPIVDCHLYLPWAFSWLCLVSLFDVWVWAQGVII